MTETDRWLTEFGVRHKNARNPGIFWPALLALIVGTVGLLWSLPIPDEFRKISPMLNWGSAFLMVSIVYYFIISVSLGIGMVPFVVGVAVLQIWLANQSVPHSYLSSVLIGAGIGGLCFGHYAGGGIRAVLRDFQLIMIAPAWLLSILYRRLGIPF